MSQRGKGQSERFVLGSALEVPACVPVYDSYSPVGGEVAPSHYIFVSAGNRRPGRLEAYVIQYSDAVPFADKGDIILLDKSRPAGEDDRVACVMDGVLHTGNLRRYGPEICLETGHGEFLIHWDQLAGVVIGVERRAGHKFN
jgi:hypothetical protein